MKKIYMVKALILFTLTVLLLTGCTFFFGVDMSLSDIEEVELREGLEQANALGAVEAIYSSLEEYSAKRLDSAAIQAIVGIYPYEIAEAHAYYSDPKFTLADVIIIRPSSTERDEVRRKLLLYRESRVREFENYDILNSHRIARDALIYDQGDYVILLMLEDTETARAIIDGYIPQ